MVTITLQDMVDLRHDLAMAEERLGLNALSHTERDVYYAASDLAHQAQNVRTGDLIEHPIAAHIPRPTFFRALKTLIAGQYLIPCGRGRYTVKEDWNTK